MERAIPAGMVAAGRRDDFAYRGRGPRRPRGAAPRRSGKMPALRTARRLPVCHRGPRARRGSVVVGLTPRQLEAVAVEETPRDILIAIDLLRPLKVEPKVLATGAAALLVAAALATHARTQVWSNPILLWQDTALKSPNKVRAHFQLAFAYYEQGRNDLAVIEFQKAAELKPPTSDLLHDWGLALDALNQPQLALAKLRQSAALDSTPQ